MTTITWRAALRAMCTVTAAGATVAVPTGLALALPTDAGQPDYIAVIGGHKEVLS